MEESHAAEIEIFKAKQLQELAASKSEITAKNAAALAKVTEDAGAALDNFESKMRILTQRNAYDAENSPTLNSALKRGSKRSLKIPSINPKMLLNINNPLPE